MPHHRPELSQRGSRSQGGVASKFRLFQVIPEQFLPDQGCDPVGEIGDTDEKYKQYYFLPIKSAAVWPLPHFQTTDDRKSEKLLPF